MASAWVEDILNSLLSEILNWGTTAVICLIQINISRLIWFGNGWAYLAALKRLQNTRVTLCFDRNLTSFSKTWTVLFYYTPNRRCRRNRDTGYRIQRLLLFGWRLIPRCVLAKGTFRWERYPRRWLSLSPMPSVTIPWTQCENNR